MTLYGYIRTSKDGAAGSDPETQRLQLLGAGVDPKNIFADVGTSGTVRVASRNGWRAVASKVDQGDTLVVAALDRIGRRSLDIQGAILDLNRRGVRIRTLAADQQFLTKYLDADPDSPEAAFGSVLVALVGLFAQMERDAISRRTKAGLERAKSEGRTGGRPPKLNDRQVEALRQDRAAGVSWGQLRLRYGIAKSTAQRLAVGNPGVWSEPASQELGDT